VRSHRRDRRIADSECAYQNAGRVACTLHSLRVPSRRLSNLAPDSLVQRCDTSPDRGTRPYSCQWSVQAAWMVEAFQRMAFAAKTFREPASDKARVVSAHVQ